MDCQLRGLVPTTLVRYRSDLKLLVALASVDSHDTVLAFTPELVRAYFSRMSAKGLTMATLHRRRAALSEFFKWGLRRRLWATDPMSDMPAIKRPRRLPRPFKAEERAALLSLKLSGVDAILRAVLYYTGLRVTPVSLIRLGDISTQAVTLGPGLVWPGSIRTIVKGNKEHIVPMHPDLRELITDFVLKRSPDLDPRSFLFAQKDGRPFTRKMIEARTRDWGRRAGVEKCTPHRFRHTFCTVLLELGVGLEVVSKLAAHEDVSTTMLYADVVDHRRAAAILQIPTIPPAGNRPGYRAEFCACP